MLSVEIFLVNDAYADFPYLLFSSYEYTQVIIIVSYIQF